MQAVRCFVKSVCICLMITLCILCVICVILCSYKTADPAAEKALHPIEPTVYKNLPNVEPISASID
jgi:hypothetical protein